jgi:hypothetical protein
MQLGKKIRIFLDSHKRPLILLTAWIKVSLSTLITWFRANTYKIKRFFDLLDIWVHESEIEYMDSVSGLEGVPHRKTQISSSRMIVVKVDPTKNIRIKHGTGSLRQGYIETAVTCNKPNVSLQEHSYVRFWWNRGTLHVNKYNIRYVKINLDINGRGRLLRIVYRPRSRTRKFMDKYGITINWVNFILYLIIIIPFLLAGFVFLLGIAEILSPLPEYFGNPANIQEYSDWMDSLWRRYLQLVEDVPVDMSPRYISRTVLTKRVTPVIAVENILKNPSKRQIFILFLMYGNFALGLFWLFALLDYIS